MRLVYKNFQLGCCDVFLNQKWWIKVLEFIIKPSLFTLKLSNSRFGRASLFFFPYSFPFYCFFPFSCSFFFFVFFMNIWLVRDFFMGSGNHASHLGEAQTPIFKTTKKGANRVVCNPHVLGRLAAFAGYSRLFWWSSATTRYTDELPSRRSSHSPKMVPTGVVCGS